MTSTKLIAKQKAEDRNLETYCLVWLDDSIIKSKESHQTQEYLRASINHLLIFEDHHLCLQFLQSLPFDERAIFILSHRHSLAIMPQIVQLRQIISVYIYSSNLNIYQYWIQNFPQVRGVIDRLDELIRQIQYDQKQREVRKLDEALPILVCNCHSHDEGQSSTELNGQFIHSQLLIDCLIRMKPSANNKEEFLTFCKEFYKNNPTELKTVEEFECEYSPARSLWWYTRHSFIFRLLNKSLRTQNIELLYLFRFYIRDLEEALKKNKGTSPIHVYRGQLMSKDEIEMLKNSIGDFISFNSFLSTSLNRHLALFYLTDSITPNHLGRVFFEINADPRLEQVKPFSDITSFSHFPNEEVVLFMIGSVFRLTDVTSNPDGIWTIRMVLCSENDHQLRILLQHMRNEVNHDQADLLQLGHILRMMGKLDDAERYFQRYLNQLSDDHVDIYPCCHALGMITDAKGDYDSSLNWYERSLQMALHIIGSEHSDIAAIHNSIALIYDNKGDYSRALEFYEKALRIWTNIYGDDHRKVATCLNNMGVAYQEEKKYSLALEFYQKAFRIWKKHLPDDHYLIGMSHNNIGEVHQCLGCYDLALEQYNLSLKIKSKSLPSQHRDTAMTYENIGKVYEHQNDHRQALSYLEKAAKIYRNSLPSIHPNVINIEQMIKRITAHNAR